MCIFEYVCMCMFEFVCMCSVGVKKVSVLTQ